MAEKVSLRKYRIEQRTPLSFDPPWPDKAHEFTRKEAVAIEAALLSGRPLLIEGPPGSGKTQIAAAAAAVLERELIVYVANSDNRPEDLLWHYDALRRLNDAQAGGKMGEPEEYLTKGPLWQAFDAKKKYRHIQDFKTTYQPGSSGQPERPEATTSAENTRGKVVLIDEIDKADRAVPNSLLEVFGHRRFYCPHIQEEIIAEEEPPLVIITSNREQDLPPAFLRRCLVLRVGLPPTEEEFIAKLAKRGEMHFDKLLAPEQYREIAEALWNMRQQSGIPEELLPGQAEYLDLVRAIGGALEGGMTDEAGKPLTFEDLLKEMAGLAFDKRGVMDETERKEAEK